MKAFKCSNCNNPLYFDNTSCEECGWYVGYSLQKNELISIDPKHSKDYLYCKNYQHNTCNWLVDDTDDGLFCDACKLNRTIPNLKYPNALSDWYLLEQAKHRLIFQLHQLKLPVQSKLLYPKDGFCFDFYSNEDISNPAEKKMTGHASGVVTIVLVEADSVQREILRKQMGEPYRTIIGHFRHEIGHYYWERMILRDKNMLASFRNIFGDERVSYSDSLQKHYKNGAPANWAQNYISKYATAHPWEDWAETWAHYLHFMDTLETAFHAKLNFHNRGNKKDNSEKSKPIINPYKEKNFDIIIDTCVPLYLALNSLNRSMGIKDIYPFVLNTSVNKKLNFIHNTINRFTS